MEIKQIERLFRRSPKCVTIVGTTAPDFPIVFANESFRKLTGYKNSEAVGRNCRFLQNDDSDQPGISVLKQAMADGKSATALIRNYKESGKLFWNEVSIEPVLDESKKVIGFIEFHQDVSVHVYMSRSLEVQQSVTNVLAELLSTQETIRQLTKSICSIMDWSYGAAWFPDDKGQLSCAFTYMNESNLDDLEKVTKSDELSRRFSSGHGVLGKAWKTGKIVVKTNVRNDKDFLRRVEAGKSDIYGTIAIPMGDSKVTAVMEFFFRKHEVPNEVLIDSFRGIASRLSRAAENKKVSKKEQMNLSLAASIGQVVATATDLGEMLQETAQAIVEHVDGAAFARIWLLPPGTSTLELVASRGQYTHLDGNHSRIEVGQYKIGRIAATRKPILTNDVLTDPNVSDPQWAEKEGMIAFAGHPLISNNKLIGVMALFSRKTLSESVMTSVETISKIVAVGIQRLLAQEELAEAQKKLNKAIVSGGIGIWEWQVDTDNTWYSPELRQLLGYSDKELPDKRDAFMALVHPDDVDSLWKDVYEHLDNDRPYSHDFRMKFKSGEYRWVNAQGQAESKVTPLRKMTGHIIDIHERKVMEAALKEAQKVAEKTAQFKQDFLATMSHEIRTPINGILGMTTVLLETQLTEIQRHYAATIQEAGHGLLSIVNDILDLSKIEAGKFEINNVPFDIGAAVESVAKILSQQANDKGLCLQTFIDPKIETSIYGDPLRLRQILLNLTGNAIKFTDFGQVFISVLLVKDDGLSTHLEISVEDTGIGIAKDQQKKIFKEFSQAGGDTATNFAGTGLGLSISQQLASMMNSKIELESKLGSGSKFFMNVSVGKAIELSTPKFSFKKQLKVVFHVEENRSSRMIKDYLKAWEADVIEVNDIDELSDLIKSDSKIDVVFMDSIGERVKLKLARSRKRPRFIYFSEHVSIKLHEIVLQSGFVKSLSLPVSRQELFESVKAAVSDRSSVKITAENFIYADVKLRGEFRVLVLEDNAINKEVIKAFLDKLGLSYDLFENGKTGLEAFLAKPAGYYDLVLTDCQMPEMDGFGFTRALRESEGGASLPVVAMTAGAFVSDRENCLAAGMNDYISKPIELAVLKEALEKWLIVEPQKNLNSPNTWKYSPAQRVDELTGMFGKEGVISLLKLFIEDTTEQLSELEAAVVGRDFDNIARFSHLIKGSSTTLRAEQMKDLCQELEYLAKSQEIDEIELRLSLLKKSFEEFRDMASETVL